MANKKKPDVEFVSAAIVPDDAKLKSELASLCTERKQLQQRLLKVTKSLDELAKKVGVASKPRKPKKGKS